MSHLSSFFANIIMFLKHSKHPGDLYKYLYEGPYRIKCYCCELENKINS